VLSDDSPSLTTDLRIASRILRATLSKIDVAAAKAVATAEVLQNLRVLWRIKHGSRTGPVERRPFFIACGHPLELWEAGSSGGKRLGSSLLMPHITMHHAG
jgi:hypothetical protein